MDVCVLVTLGYGRGGSRAQGKVAVQSCACMVLWALVAVPDRGTELNFRTLQVRPSAGLDTGMRRPLKNPFWGETVSFSVVRLA